MKVFKKIVRFLGKVPVYIYKGLLSPILPKSCRFFPTCSTYFIEAIDEFGIIKGSKIGIKRICRCNPKNHNCGYDPIPINIKGEHKWLF